MAKEESNTQPNNNVPAVQQPPATVVPLTQRFGITLDSKGYPDLPSMGSILQQSGFFPDVQRASQGMVKVLLGRELGIAAITAVIGIHILTNSDGKVTVMIGSHLKAGKIKQSGTYDYEVDESTAEKCVLIPKVKNPETGKWEFKKPVTFTIQQAKTMRVGGYGKYGEKFADNSNWAKFPEDMLFNRCVARMEKMHFPNISAAPTYTPDELGFREDEKGEAVIVEGSLVRDETGEKVPVVAAPEPAVEEKPVEKKPRPRANAVMIAKLASHAKKHKWERDRFFEMTVKEGAYVIDPETARELYDAKKYIALDESIAEDFIERGIKILEMGYDLWLDSRQRDEEKKKQGDLLDGGK